MKQESLDEVTAFVIWDGWSCDFAETWTLVCRLHAHKHGIENIEVQEHLKAASEFAGRLHNIDNYEEKFTVEDILHRIRSNDFDL